MENASKALIMAAEVLVGVLIITCGGIMVRAFSNYGAGTTASMDDTKRTVFNNQFTKYYDSTTITIHDIITVSNLAQENNFTYEYVKKDYYNFDEGWLFDEYVITEILNDEVEILQITIHNEKKIEKLDVKGTFTKNQKKIANKINEIIDHIQE